MSNLNIHATLGVAPATTHRPHEVLVITRGASAELLFNFINHSYLIDINEHCLSADEKEINLEKLSLKLMASGCIDNTIHHFLNKVTVIKMPFELERINTGAIKIENNERIVN